MKDCPRWRRSECPGDSSCVRWEHCTLMNDNAVPLGTKEDDYNSEEF